MKKGATLKTCKNPNCTRGEDGKPKEFRSLYPNRKYCCYGCYLKNNNRETRLRIKKQAICWNPKCHKPYDLMERGKKRTCCDKCGELLKTLQKKGKHFKSHKGRKKYNIGLFDKVGKC